jgi:hypothetical protein
LWIFSAGTIKGQAVKPRDDKAGFVTVVFLKIKSSSEKRFELFITPQWPVGHALRLFLPIADLADGPSRPGTPPTTSSGFRGPSLDFCLGGF